MARCGGIFSLHLMDVLWRAAEVSLACISWMSYGAPLRCVWCVARDGFSLYLLDDLRHATEASLVRREGRL